MVDIYHETKTAKDMVSGVNLLEKLLGKRLFQKFVNVLLTDRGSEFIAADALENSGAGTRCTSQKQLNLALSHINSAPVEKLGGRSPLDMAEFMYPDLYKKLCSFGLSKIDTDQIILKPYLLKRDR